ncbi:hypothetical protein Tco_1181959 [Tanacetum coccineum]
MDDPNITMEEYIRLEEEKAHRRAIVFNDALTSEVTLSYEPTVSPLNDNKIDFRISFDESDDEDYTRIIDWRVEERGDVVAGIKRRRRDLSSDGIEDLTTASGRIRLKSNLEDSTW